MGKDRDHSNEMIEVSGEMRQETAKAYGIFCGDYSDEPTTHGKPKEILEWLPKSQCKKGDEPNTWMVPQWLAYDKGLI